MSRPNEFDADPEFGALPEGHRSGFVAVLGRPNVGKSTLMNALLGDKVAIVSPRPQTTRRNQIGILTLEKAQLVFVDTPGIHIAQTALGEYMVEAAQEAAIDADLALFLVDQTDEPDAGDRAIAELLAREDEAKVLLLLNKADLLRGKKGYVDDYRALLPKAESISISATTKEGLDALLARVIALLPEGPRFYPAEQLTETYIRDDAAEQIRETILERFEDEVPHAVFVEVDEYKEREGELTYIRATIYVERDTQKQILIGKNGTALKELGSAARLRLEELVGTKVYLDLWVKVAKNWRRDWNQMRQFGFQRRRKPRG